MRVLFVEDKATFAEEVDGAIARIPDCDELVWVRSRDGALEKIASESFDLVLLDRKLPTGDDVLDDHIDHGWAVFQTVQAHSPGTPVWFLTGTEDADFAADINNDYGRAEDLHGRNATEQMYRVFWKKRIDHCLQKLGEFAAFRKALERIAVQTMPLDLGLDAEEARVVRLFGNRHHAAAMVVTSLNGGLSNSRVLKIVAKAADGRVLTTAAAKVSSLPETKAEAERYQNEILRLRPGGFPQLAAKIEVACGNKGGLFYGMVGETVESLFNRIALGHPEVPRIPAELRSIMGPWYQGKRIEQIQVAQIRRRFIRDTALPGVQEHMAGINIGDIEGHVVLATTCCQHRDLHCANVVFDGRGRAMLIDFGDTGQAYASVDPVTLELSTVFHSQHVSISNDWPSEAAITAWLNLDEFTRECPFAAFISACREWANAEAGSPGEVVAVAYGYAMRQLKYQDTNKALARALIRSCIAFFRAPVQELN